MAGILFLSPFNTMTSVGSMAVTVKDDGSIHFQENNFTKAVKAYTEDIQQKCSDNDLSRVLLTNRAAANFRLGKTKQNYASRLLATRGFIKYSTAVVTARQMSSCEGTLRVLCMVVSAGVAAVYPHNYLQ